VPISERSRPTWLTDALAIQLGAFARDVAKQLLPQRIVDDTCSMQPRRCADRNGKLRETMQEIRRAIRRIDDQNSLSPLVGFLEALRGGIVLVNRLDNVRSACISISVTNRSDHRAYIRPMYGSFLNDDFTRAARRTTIFNRAAAGPRSRDKSR
jgi:hypothetical protein